MVMMAMPLDILLAEDDPLNAMALHSVLDALGHNVIGPVGNGLEAIERARGHAVDLAILDLRMPEVSGAEAAEEIFRIQPLPVILLTGYSKAELPSRAAGVPVLEHLVKPVSASDLSTAIQRVRARFREWNGSRGEAGSTAA